MVHTLYDSQQQISISITVTPLKNAFIEIDSGDIKEGMLLNKQQLHEFIGTLLHVQSKLK